MRQISKLLSVVSLFLLLLFITILPVQAQLQLPPPDSVNLDSLGYMTEFPPSPDKLVNLQNKDSYPRQRWVFQHTRELATTRNIRRGPGPILTLKSAPRNFDGLVFEDEKGNKMTFAEWQKNTYTDALVVLHKGKLVYERYYNKGARENPHILFSVTKSFTGLLALQLIRDGKLDKNALVTKYVPELADSAWGDMKVQEVLDMTGAVRFREVYDDPATEIFGYMFACNMITPPPNYAGPKTIYDFLKTLKKDGTHGARFEYRTVHSEVLGWIVSRITGKHYADLMSDRIWQKLGMEEDAYVLMDPVGTPWQGAGLCATARDLARFGEMLRCGGKLNGKRIFDKEIIDEIRKGGDRESVKTSALSFLAGYSYHNQWWILHNADGAYEAIGVHGQNIHINPAAQLVIIKLSSHPVAALNLTHPIQNRAWEALSKAVKK